MGDIRPSHVLCYLGQRARACLVDVVETGSTCTSMIPAPCGVEHSTEMVHDSEEEGEELRVD